VPIEKDQLITLGVVVALAGVFAFAVWMPANRKSQALDRRIDAAKSELGMTPVAKDELIQLNSAVTELRAVVNGAQQYVPIDDEIAHVVRGVNEALKAHGVTEQEMVTRQAQRYAHYNTIPISIEYESSFPVVFGALREIEKMPRLIRVDRLGIMGDSDDPAEPLEVHMELSTFYSRGQEAR